MRSEGIGLIDLEIVVSGYDVELVDFSLLDPRDESFPHTGRSLCLEGWLERSQ